MLTLENTPIPRLFILVDEEDNTVAAIWANEGVLLKTTYTSEDDSWETDLETHTPYFMVRSAEDYGAELRHNRYNESFRNPLGEVFPLTPSATQSERNPMLMGLLTYLAEKEGSDLPDSA